MPSFLNKYFQTTNYILVYPMQAGVGEGSISELRNPTVLEPLEKLGDIGKSIAAIFGKK